MPVHFMQEPVSGHWSLWRITRTSKTNSWFMLQTCHRDARKQLASTNIITRTTLPLQAYSSVCLLASKHCLFCCCNTQPHGKPFVFNLVSKSMKCIRSTVLFVFLRCKSIGLHRLHSRSRPKCLKSEPFLQMWQICSLYGCVSSKKHWIQRFNFCFWNLIGIRNVAMWPLSEQTNQVLCDFYIKPTLYWWFHGTGKESWRTVKQGFSHEVVR